MIRREVLVHWALGCVLLTLAAGVIGGISAAIWTGHAGWLILAVVCGIILAA